MVVVRQKEETGTPVVVCHESMRKAVMERRMNCFALSASLAAVVASGCSKAQTSSVLGDAAHPTPVHFYAVAEETARRRIQAVGSLFALEESTLSSQVDGRVDEVLADVGDTV